MQKKGRRQEVFHMDKSQNDLPKSPGITVHYHNNSGLLRQSVAFHWWDAAYTSLHDHDYYEFFIITSGRTNHILNGVCQELCEKTLCLIRPQDQHQFTPLPGGRCIHINLPVTGRKLEQLCAAIGMTLEQLLQIPQRQLLEDTDFALFKQSAREINLLREASAPGSSITPIICQMLVNALVILGKQRAGISAGAPEWLSQVLPSVYRGNGGILPHPHENGLCQTPALLHRFNRAGNCRPPRLQQHQSLQ